MRLGCPGCGAQYEVGAEAIPAGGCEVECSACGRNWFQHAPPAARQGDAVSTPPPGVAPASVSAPPPVLSPDPVPASTTVPAAAIPALLPKDFRALLREEARRETEERRREGIAPIPAMPASPEPMPAPRRRGFLTGFLMVAIPLAILAGLYAGAPRLGREVPALAAPLGQYVAGIDSLRVRVDGWLDRVR